MELLLNSEFNNIRVPKGFDKVYKDECIYSFRTPVSARDCTIFDTAAACLICVPPLGDRKLTKDCTLASPRSSV